tara:strand:+ start:10269 stop:10415 length:147 start_codon:yes stop_codon:yes gene_type:complete
MTDEKPARQFLQELLEKRELSDEEIEVYLWFFTHGRHTSNGFYRGLAL